MQSVQESKQELQAAIRYAENAISSANATIESMEFRQEMAKKQSSEKTGREESLLKKLEVMTDKHDMMKGYADQLALEYKPMKDELDKLRKEKEASSGTCGCQGYRDLQEEAARLKSDNIRLKASLDTASEHIKDVREELNEQRKFDEEVRQGVNDFLDFLDTIGYERA